MADDRQGLFQDSLEVLKDAQKLQAKLKKALNDPASASKAQAVEAQLAALRARIGAGISAASAEPAGLVFKSLNQAAEWLRGQGYKISDSTIYSHRNRNLVNPRPDGLYHEADLLRYAQTTLKRKDGGGSEKLEALQERKVLAELERAEAQTAKMQLQHEILEGKYIKREDHERDLATRARLLKADMQNFGRLMVENLIHLVGGDPGRAPEALAFVERHVERWLHHYAARGEIRPVADGEPK
jgi:hypothetical protein